MNFNTGLKIGDKITNQELIKIFKCANMGGMRRSKRTNTLVLVSDETKGLYRDVWKNGVLHYAGMGKIGDQVLEKDQNRTLYHSKTNGVEVHLFEVMDKAVYTYRGIVTLADCPYQELQLDDNGEERKVWIFPLKPVTKVQETIENCSEIEIAQLSNKELIRRSEIISINREPKKVSTLEYYRDPYLKEIVKRIAEGKCQYCSKDAPFYDKKGTPYLEEHHVKWLSQGGTDSIDNLVAVCPNCHKMMHILNNENDFIILENVAIQNAKKYQRMLAYNEKTKK